MFEKDISHELEQELQEGTYEQSEFSCYNDMSQMQRQLSIDN